MIGAFFILFGSQLMVTLRYDSGATISGAGSYNFSNRFFPAVYGRVEGLGFVAYNTEDAETARAERKQIGEQFGYVISHPIATISTWIDIFWHYHLTEPTGFALWDNHSAEPQRARNLTRLSIWFNKIFLATSVLGLAGCAVYVHRTAWRNWPAALIAPSILVTAPLVYWQGDRIVFLPFLFLLPFAGLFIRAIEVTVVGQATNQKH